MISIHFLKIFLEMHAHRLTENSSLEKINKKIKHEHFFLQINTVF